jgi:peptidoglycan/xylan/chitin deacetylase (PgdA/CDA1 family)
MLMKTLAVNLLDMSGAALLLRPFYGGCGAVLALHRVLPEDVEVFEEGNVVRVEQLREALQFVRKSGSEFVPLDEIPERLRGSPAARRFVAITLDDGYLDNLTHGLPVFREFNAPFAVFPATGFVNRTSIYDATLTAELLRGADTIVLEHPRKGRVEYPCRTEEEKRTVPGRVGWGWEPGELIASLRQACEKRGLNVGEILDRHFLSWDQLRTLAQDPLATIGVHTVTHAMLARLPEEQAVFEMSSARRELEQKLKIPVRHIAYPLGSPGACGEREFRLARELDFATGYTTHRGNLHHRHQHTLWSLPRHTLSMVKHSANVRYLRLSLAGIWDSPINGTLVHR